MTRIKNSCITVKMIMIISVKEKQMKSVNNILIVIRKI